MPKLNFCCSILRNQRTLRMTKRMRQLKITKQITSRDDKALDKYLTEIGRKKLITAEEEIALAKRIKDGDEEAIKTLVEANLRFVVSVAKQYQSQGMTLTDLINEGNLGLIKAAQRFDHTRGFKFISYAVWWVRQSILAALAEQGRMVRLPLNKISIINKINKAFAKLEQELERPPSTEELAAELGVSEDSIEETLRASAGRHTSVDSPFKEDESNNSLLDVLEDTSATPADKKLLSDSLRTELDRLMNMMPKREQEVVELYFGLKDGKPQSLEEIGARFDLTRERVRQIKEKAIRRLRHTGGRKDFLRVYLAD